MKLMDRYCNMVFRSLMEAIYYYLREKSIGQIEML